MRREGTSPNSESRSTLGPKLQITASKDVPLAHFDAPSELRKHKRIGAFQPHGILEVHRGSSNGGKTGHRDERDQDSRSRDNVGNSGPVERGPQADGSSG